MKLIIAGSREITDYSLLKSVIVKSGFWTRYKNELEIVSGCARGVDRLGEQFAERNGLKLHQFPADWATYDKRAGPIRNAQMARFADALLALWNGESTGTADMIAQATHYGLEVKAYKCKLVWSLKEVETT